ncbi:MAG: hypothetical protein QNJ77_13010 [Acidimicrobiia bacterium]|nr:hypothetical protein [Acidimicrobiia bacterium]
MHDRLHFDLIETMANDRHSHAAPRSQALRSARSEHGLRMWAGQKLISLGERIVPTPGELQLEPSTGPPCP